MFPSHDRDPTLVINDILEIGSERVKVLNIEPNRLRVAREHDGTTSTDLSIR